MVKNIIDRVKNKGKKGALGLVFGISRVGEGTKYGFQTNI
jgi:hypothetical protein